MQFKGKVWKAPNSSWWLAEVFFLDLMTQGKTKKEALEMLKDAVLELLQDSYEDLFDKKFQLTLNQYEDDCIGIGGSNNKLLFSLGLKRQYSINR